MLYYSGYMSVIAMTLAMVKMQHRSSELSLLPLHPLHLLLLLLLWKLVTATVRSPAIRVQL